MAKVYTEEMVVTLSVLRKETDEEPELALTDEQKQVVVQTVEELVDNSSVVVEIK